MIEILTPYLGEIIAALGTGLVTGIMGLIFHRQNKRAELKLKEAEIKQRDAEIEKLRIDNGGEIMRHYREALNDLDKRNEANVKYLREEYTRRYDELAKSYEDRIARIRKETDEKLKQQDRKIDQLTRQVSTWKGKYQSLKTEFDRYKKNHE